MPGAAPLTRPGVLPAPVTSAETGGHFRPKQSGTFSCYGWSLSPKYTHAVGSLKAQQASTHHDRRATASTPDVLLKLHGVVDRAHHEDASRAETLNCRHERKRTCCQKQAIVGNGLAVLREYLTMDRVDPACRDSAPVIDASDVSPVTGHEVKLADGGTRPT